MSHQSSDQSTASTPAEQGAARASTPLAARLTARRGTAGGQVPAAEPAPSTPTAPGAGEQPGAKPHQQPRVRRVSEPPPLLRPVALSEAPAESTARVSDEEIAEAALRQLLRREGDDTSARASSAASVARRYFDSARPARAKQGGPPPEALQMLAMRRGQGYRSRVAGLVGTLLALCLMGALLFTALLTVG